jgi:hypothetical protein
VIITQSTGTAGTADYTENNTTIIIPASTLGKEFNISTLIDSIAEGNETFTINVTLPNGNTDSSIGTIVDKLSSQARIEGIVYEDSNGNGVQDIGELGLASVRVQIIDGLGIEHNISTDTHGNYIKLVASGSIKLTIDESMFSSGIRQTQGTNSTTITVNAGGVIKDINGFVILAPSISLVKLVSSISESTTIGNVITYTFVVTNTGNTPLSSIHIEDTRINITNLAVVDLAVGASARLTANYTITASDMEKGSIVNQATVSGLTPSGTMMSDTSDDNSTLEDEPTVLNLPAHPAIAMIKTAVVPSKIFIGAKMLYSFEIVNTGDVPLYDVYIDDLRINLLDFKVQNMAVGERITVSVEYNITRADIIDIVISNQATVYATSSDGVDVSDLSDNDSILEDDITITPVEFSNVFDPPSALKEANPGGWPEIEWKMVWINDGNVLEMNVHIEDPLSDDLTFLPGTLKCDARGDSSTDNSEIGCFYDEAQHKIIWNGIIAPDFELDTEDTATHEVVITFRTNVPDYLNTIENQAIAYWDQDQDGIVDYNKTVSTDDPNTVAGTDSTVVNNPFLENEVQNVVNCAGVALILLIDGEQLISFTQPSHGVVSLDNAGTELDLTDDILRYVADSAYLGHDSFTYTVIDANGDTIVKTKNVIVEKSNYDAGDALGTWSFLIMMMLTALIALYYIRKEEEVLR